ncbi:MAG: metal ABC transporter permease [Dehalococcoidales bacterium]|nr:metal ABC transporter permease [Dehalococcoidales bacterium]
MFDIFGYHFMQNAMLAALLASIACGIIGVYVVSKRIVFISGGIAHASFGGIGLGYFIGISPVLGATIFSIISAITMGVSTRRTRLPEDTVIGILWATGMALGAIFISLTPGYTTNLFSYLFGNILTVPDSELLLILILDVVILAVVVLLYKEFLAISFDEEYSTVIGMPTEKIYLILLCLIALTIVVMIRVVGIILVIALLTIPASLARQFTNDMKKMMVLSVIFSIIFTFTGLFLSYILDLASGATIIITSVIIFATVISTRKLLSSTRLPSQKM